MIRVVSRTYQGLVYLLLYLPIAVLIAFSFNDSRSSYRRVISSSSSRGEDKAQGKGTG